MILEQFSFNRIYEINIFSKDFVFDIFLPSMFSLDHDQPTFLKKANPM